ncbi:hypothetical protein X771_32130 [Mesorhizobium sp. LSJC277A00]|nr:hypothetical protein X771_32130 [Mesorhizobium sp. LSJC277A00]
MAVSISFGSWARLSNPQFLLVATLFAAATSGCTIFCFREMFSLLPDIVPDL